jgi:hypothetical protein
MQSMTISALPFASIENDFLRVDYLTTTGPRISGLYAKGVDGNILAETPDVHWPTPHGEYFLRGGHRLWIAPENPFYTCPEDNVIVVAQNDLVILRSTIDVSGLEKEIHFHLNKNCVELTHRVTWHGNEPIAFAPWAITQLRLGSMAILPQSHSDGLQPNRNLVFWPYSQVNDERLELHNDLILVHGRGREQAFKVGNNNSHGWIACSLDNALFVKRFTVNNTQQYPDMGCNVEAYVKDSCLELETLGALTILKPNESVTHKEIWDVTVGEYPPILKTAREISKQLSLK